MDDIQIETVMESNIDEELDERIRSFLTGIFPEWESVFRKERTWHDAKPVFSVLAAYRGEIMGHVAVVERTISTCWNFRYNVASIQGVSVAVAYRGHNLGQRLLQVALERAAELGFPFAILFCKESMVSFYQRLGWKLPNDSMVMWRDRDLPVAMRSNCPMYWVLPRLSWPEGPVDVHNPLDPPVKR